MTTPNISLPTDDDLNETLATIAEYVRKLDGSLSHGGVLPDAWATARREQTAQATADLLDAVRYADRILAAQLVQATQPRVIGQANDATLSRLAEDASLAVGRLVYQLAKVLDPTRDGASELCDRLLDALTAGRDRAAEVLREASAGLDGTPR